MLTFFISVSLLIPSPALNVLVNPLSSVLNVFVNPLSMC